MLDIFWYKLILAFLVGSSFVVLITYIAERFGTKIGGLLGGFPTTILVSLFFIGFTQSPKVAFETTTLVPLSIGFAQIFLLLYVLFSKKSFFTGLIVSLIGWLILAGIVVFYKINTLWISLLFWLIGFLFTYYIFEKKLDLSSIKGEKTTYSKKQIIFRALFSGAIISFAVLVTKFAGPLVGGIFAGFPSTFISSISIVYYSKGLQFSRAIAKPLVVSGAINCLVYTLAVRYLYLPFGIYLGTILALIISCISAYFVYKLIKRNS